MKKLLLLSLMFFTYTQLFAQEKNEVKEGWTTNGTISFIFNQSAFENWISGGENNLAGNLGVNYNFNYLKKEINWDNKITASYGLTKSKNSEFEKKTDDRIIFNSILGKKANNLWYYSIFLNFDTQFTTGYKYSKDENGKEIRTEFTNFMSPANLSFGPGMLWKKSDNLKFNLAPATAKLILVDKLFTLPNGDYYGVEQGKSSRFELGFNASAYAKFSIMENVSMENILNLYADYLGEPQNIDLDYAMNIVMKINKYLSTNLTFQTIYNDNAFEGFQIREVFGIGINYSL
ncbi:MAG: DUF3078 domain-containing protein [Lutibacter sp.]|uniref:DUF3078 domain-containing protein n=1 Tax=Lutibacter sp. TaxID=1925666 RepID=UPI00385C229A